MLASSSKRALSSTSAVTDLPASAASASALTIGESVGRAVERLLDRDDVRIARRLIEELHHHVERFVRVMDDQVLLADRREAVAALIADALGEARIVRHEFQVGPVDRDELRQLVQRQHAVDQEHLVVGDAERALHERAQLGRHRRLRLRGGSPSRGGGA